MRKNFCLLVLIMALTACSGNGASSSIANSSNEGNDSASSSENGSSGSSSSSSSSSSSDPGPQLTEEERKVKEVTDYLASNPLAFSGHYTAVDSYIPDSTKPEEKIVQRTYDYGTFTSVATDVFCYKYRDENRDAPTAVRYDHDGDGYLVNKILNPLTNQKMDSYVLDPSGRKMSFEGNFGNPFKDTNVYRFFELKGNKIITKEIEDENDYFAYDKLVNIAVGAMYGEYRRIVISLDSDSKPSGMSIEFWNPGRFAVQEYTLDCTFVNPESVNVPALPEVHTREYEHTALQDKFDAMINQMNYQIDYQVTGKEGGGTTFTLYVNKDFYYVNYPEHHEVDKGGYYVRGKGLTDLYYTDSGVTAKGLPKKAHNVEEMFTSFWRYKAEMFYLNNDGNYVLSDDAGLYDNVRYYLVPDLAGFSFSYINPSSFKMTIDNDDLLYTYDVSTNHVSARISNIGSTEKPFTIESVIPYDPIDDMNEYIDRMHPSNKEDLSNRIGLMVNYNYDILPYVDTPYEHSSKMDCIGTVGIGLVYTMDIIFTFRFDSSEEMWDVANKYSEILDAMTDYVYDYDNECYLYQHDGVNFKITFTLGENMNGYKFALVYRIDNLNAAPPLEW